MYHGELRAATLSALRWWIFFAICAAWGNAIWDPEVQPRMYVIVPLIAFASCDPMNTRFQKDRLLTTGGCAWAAAIGFLTVETLQLLLSSQYIDAIVATMVLIVVPWMAWKTDSLGIRTRTYDETELIHPVQFVGAGLCVPFRMVAWGLGIFRVSPSIKNPGGDAKVKVISAETIIK